jgi:steroid 5-alpha reductase family enzyme
MAFFKEKPLKVDVQALDREPARYQFGTGPPSTAHVETPTLPHQPFPSYATSLFDVGIFKDTLAPSFALNSSLAIIAWGIGRSTNRVDAKDIIWPAAPVLNVWWSAIGRRVVLDGRSFPQALKVLSWPERLLVTGVTVWGARLLYATATRSTARGKDDPKYDAVKKEEGFWNQALVKVFLPEALFQTVIALPFTAPFRHRGAVMTGYHPYIQMLAVGLFGTGFALEALADWQLKKHKETDESLFQGGVWSIVRNPKYTPSSLFPPFHPSHPPLSPPTPPTN